MRAGLVFAPIAILCGASATVKLTIPAGLDKAESRLVLHLENLKLPPGASGVVRVFADLPDANTKTSTDDEHYLGYFTVLAKNSVEAARGVQRSSITWDLSAKRQRLANKKEVTLSLVPLTQDSAQDKPVFSRAYFDKN